MGEKPDAHYHAQPGGLDGTSHLRTRHEPHGRLGETLAHCTGLYWWGGEKKIVIDL